TLMIAGDLVRASRDATTRERIVVTLMAFQAVFLALYLYSPHEAAPSEEVRRDAEALNRAVAALEGGVVCPLSPFLPLRNGHQTPQAHFIAHIDAMNAHMAGVTTGSYVSWIIRERPRWVLLDDRKEEAPLRRLLATNYEFARKLPGPTANTPR